MTRVTTISISLTMFLFFSILYIAPTAQAQSCDEIAKSMKREGSEINKIQKQMTNSIENSYFEPSKYEKKVDEDKKLMDRHNRHFNILIHNLERRIISMKGLLKNAKQQANNCQDKIRAFSNKVNSVFEIHAKMEQAIANTKTTEREFKDLIKSLN